MVDLALSFIGNHTDDALDPERISIFCDVFLFDADQLVPAIAATVATGFGNNSGHPFPVVFLAAMGTADDIPDFLLASNRFNAFFGTAGCALDGVLWQHDIYLLGDLIPKAGMLAGRFAVSVTNGMDQLVHDGIFCRLIAHIVLKQTRGNVDRTGGCRWVFALPPALLGAGVYGPGDLFTGRVAQRAQLRFAFGDELHQVFHACATSLS